MPNGGKGEATHHPVTGGAVDSMPTSMNFQLAKYDGRNCSKWTTWKDGEGDIIIELVIYIVEIDLECLRKYILKNLLAFR